MNLGISPGQPVMGVRTVCGHRGSLYLSPRLSTAASTQATPGTSDLSLCFHKMHSTYTYAYFSFLKISTIDTSARQAGRRLFRDAQGEDRA